MTRIWVLLAGCALSLGLLADDYVSKPLDGFEDLSPWIKGDPTTDLTQREVALAPDTDFVKQGKQSFAFMIRVDWSEQPGVKYARGWPMVSRQFDPPQDWSEFDRVEFWLYTKTEALLPRPALKCGFAHDGKKATEWLGVEGITANEWQRLSVPLAATRDWSRVTGIYFYIAEAWYHDGDRIDFYFDDLALAARRTPRLQSCTATSRVSGRGQTLAIEAALEGPAGGCALACTVTDAEGAEAARVEEKLAGKVATLAASLVDVRPGLCRARVELQDAQGQALDARDMVFRRLDPQRKTYLSLISFYTKSPGTMPTEQLALLNQSAYEGVAIPIVGGYRTDPPPSREELDEPVRAVRNSLTIDPWPWVFSNHFVGRPQDARTHPSNEGNKRGAEHFGKIKGLDLDDAAGARSEMYAIWRLAVRLAKEWGAPGIVIDLEAYNNYRAYDVNYVAERRGETPAQVVAQCEAVGAELGRIVEQEYPECIVWSLFSHLQNPRRLPGCDGPVYSTAGHITLGFLKHCRDRKLPAKYICGGETTPGYYNPSVEALRGKIAARDAAMAPIIEAYPDHFFLGGTISPYHDHTLLTDWIKRRAGDDPPLKTIADFQPMFRTLFEAYDWVWIYAASASRSQPYKPEQIPLYGDVLRAALEEAVRPQ